MSIYNSYVGQLASDLQDSNMQKHMGSISSDVSRESREFKQKIIDYEFDELIRLIYLTALGDRDRYLDGDILKKHFLDNEDDLIPIFLKMNEDSLNDPDFTNAIANNSVYYKKIGSEKDNVLFYIPGRTSSMGHDVFMDIVYFPSRNEEELNRFRINVKEKPAMGYPYLNFSVDIFDNGDIKYLKPMIIDKKEDGTIIKTPTDMSSAHISFNRDGVIALRDVFMDIFEKARIKDNTSGKRM